MHTANPPGTPRYSIGTATSILGISVHTMRMYERTGLIIPHKTETGQRLSAESDIERLCCIRNAINVGKISIEGIRRMLSLIPGRAIVHCGEADRQGCAAYNGHAEPCWAVKHGGVFCADRDSRSCESYKNYGDGKSIQERLRSFLPL